MRNGKSTLVLLAVFVGLALLAVLAQGPLRRDRPREQSPLFPGMQPQAVQAIRIGRAPDALVIAREEGRWTVGPEKLPADAALVDRMLQGLAGLRVGAPVSTNPANQALYEADDARGKPVRLEGASGAVIGELVVGKSGPDFTSCYLRRAGAAEVFLVAMDVRGLVSRPLSGWREQEAAPDSPAEKEAELPSPALDPQ